MCNMSNPPLFFIASIPERYYFVIKVEKDNLNYNLIRGNTTSGNKALA